MSVQKKFNYDEIETGYYDNIYKKKTGIRSAWHHIKFLYLKKKNRQKKYSFRHRMWTRNFSWTT